MNTMKKNARLWWIMGRKSANTAVAHYYGMRRMTKAEAKYYSNLGGGANHMHSYETQFTYVAECEKLGIKP